MTTSIGRTRWVPTGLLLGSGTLMVFTVPYLFGHPDGHSQSFIAHFNNHAAILILLVFSILLGLKTEVFGLRYVGQSAVCGSRWPLWVVAGLSVVLVCMMWGLDARVGATGEATYFLDRYAQHALGLNLYWGMEFSYGPLLFWPQVWLARAAELRLGDAHFVVLIAEWPAGFTLLWYVCRQLAACRRDVMVLFWMLSGVWANAIIDGGMNYTPLRFLAAPALALWVWKRLRAGRSAREVLGWALAGFWGLLFFSPEQGIAFGFGTVVFFGTMARRREMLPALTMFAAGCGAGVLVTWRIGVLNTLLSIGGGVLDFPVLPSARMAVLIAGIMLAGALGVRALKTGAGPGPELYLTALCAALLPAAFGRADSGHVFINMLPLLAIAFCAMAQTRKGFELATAALGGYMVMAGLLHVGPFVKTELWQVRHRELLAAAKGGGEKRLLAPMGFPRAFDEARTLPVVTGKYSSYLSLMNGGVPAVKLEELAREPGTSLALPQDWRERCTVSEKDRRLELKAALHPWVIPGARNRDTSPQVLCDYIGTHYEATGRAAPAMGFEVYRPR